ncbi:MAG: GatB/YqeY domain-containing protein [Candidatus Synoicihabitans palmerolidicus]|nr:GatB/YqeY domain-containing protein [Candidatus Synoicihabitans palmerolidicus]
MSLYATLRADIITAMKARDTAKATILRTADAAIQRTAMDTDSEISDDMVVTVFRKTVKNLTDANVDFSKAGRTDLVDKNLEEICVLETYLPAQITGAKLEAIVVEAVTSTGATTRKEMGKVMGVLKRHPEAGLIDFGAASKFIQSRLN